MKYLKISISKNSIKKVYIGFTDIHLFIIFYIRIQKSICLTFNKVGLIMNTLEKNSYVMNNKTGKSYVVTTDTVQTRNRRQVLGTEILHPVMTQIAESHLTPIDIITAGVCFTAEKIIRGKHKLSDMDKQYLIMYRALKKSIVK